MDGVDELLRAFSYDVQRTAGAFFLMARGPWLNLPVSLTHRMVRDNTQSFRRARAGRGGARGGAGARAAERNPREGIKFLETFLEY